MSPESEILKKRDAKIDGTMLPLVEEFFTIQGEGFHTGKPAYFIRLGGCDVGCSWCDTPFAWDPEQHPLVDTDEIIRNAVKSGADTVVVTGGEPFMWNLNYLCAVLRRNNICTYIETSGAYEMSGKWDWICLSPKKNMPPPEEMYRIADELKVIIEKHDDLEWAEGLRMNVRQECHLFLQPEWSIFETIIPEIVSYVKKNPRWRISLQVHKFMHIP